MSENDSFPGGYNYQLIRLNYIMKDCKIIQYEVPLSYHSPLTIFMFVKIQSKSCVSNLYNMEIKLGIKK